MVHAHNVWNNIIDYIAPETRLFRCKYGLLFGSRSAQAPLIQRAKDLFERGYFEHLIVSGGCTHNIDQPEAIKIAEKLIRSGVPSENIIADISP